MKTDKNMAVLVVLGVLVATAIAYGAYMLGQHNKASNQPGPGPVQHACTLEAKLCPDGSYVGRGGPKCDFSPCKGEPAPAPSGPSGM